MTSLTDDLFAPREATEPPPVTRTTDDEYLELDNRSRSRITTGLIVALIFASGVLTGVLITPNLAPTPPPQTIYILVDAETPSASTTSSPPSSSATASPPR